MLRDTGKRGVFPDCQVTVTGVGVAFRENWTRRDKTCWFCLRLLYYLIFICTSCVYKKDKYGLNSFLNYFAILAQMCKLAVGHTHLYVCVCEDIHQYNAISIQYFSG